MHCNLHIQTPSSERFERIDLHTKRSNTYEIEVLANLTQAFPNALHPITTGVIVGTTNALLCKNNKIYTGDGATPTCDSNSMVESSECRGSCGFESHLSRKTI